MRFLNNENSSFDLNTKELKITLNDNCNCEYRTNSNFCNNNICLNKLNELIRESENLNVGICGLAYFKYYSEHSPGYDNDNQLNATIESVSISNNNEVIIKFNKLSSNIETIDDIFPILINIHLNIDECNLCLIGENYFLNVNNNSFK